ncbi:hypothetical protein NLX86_09490 [Streptomyces sp. A3M-1-3]|uniref:hypothetical protein n=1 Tax=Streptomyces sp. A3M-1-3 TaxID=2962044 RepID=UPI0020B818FA|nr:hypothetical protein [Streptomyces sp. A3M-1-3]MCP3818340.1 hypothetical protein [Streptomyces sp. A3M-1-3]
MDILESVATDARRSLILPQTDESCPAIWFRLPPGYHDIKPVGRDELEEALTTVVGPPGNAALSVDEALNEAGLLMDLVRDFHHHGGVHSAFGLHREGSNRATVSFFTLSALSTVTRDPNLAVARVASSLAQSPMWGTRSHAVLELACSLPAALVTGVLETPSKVSVFQARLAVSYPSGAYIAVADLTSPSVEHSDAYTAILESIGQTISFTDPNTPATSAQAGTSRILELLP